MKETLFRAVESALSQSETNFEFLILDDGSLDETWNYLQREVRDSRVQIFRNEKNLGVISARNQLLSLCRGKYVSILDADDIWAHHKLKTQIQILDSDEEIGMVWGQAIRIDGDREETVPPPQF